MPRIQPLKTIACGIAVSLAAAGAFMLRTAFLQERVFTSEQVVLAGRDSWRHLRLTEYQVRHFPRRLAFDPYAVYPGGATVRERPLLDFVAAGLIRLAVGPDASLQTIEMLAAFCGPLLAAAAALAAFGLGRALHGPVCGLLASAWVAVMPGEFFVRSALGSFDPRSLDVLLAALLLVQLVRAVRAGSAAADGRAAQSPRAWLPRSLAAAGLLGCCLLAGPGGVLMIAAVAVACVVQQVRNVAATRHRSALTGVFLVTFAAAALGMLPFVGSVYRTGEQLVALIAAAVLVAVHGFVAGRLTRAGRGWPARVIAAVMLSAAVPAAVRLSCPRCWDMFLGVSSSCLPLADAKALGDNTPAFLRAALSARPAVGEFFRLGLPLALAGLVILACRFVRFGETGETLLMVWSAAALVALFSGGRWDHLGVLGVALLSAFAWCKTLGSRRAPHSHAAMDRASVRRAASWLLKAVALLAATAASLADLPAAIRFHDGPDGDWFESLDWLQKNTPEPFGDPARYAARAAAPTGSDFHSPLAACGVLSACENGAWIETIARRVPVCNCEQGRAAQVAAFFLAQSEPQADELMEKLGARYVVLDVQSARPERIAGLAAQAGRRADEFCEPVIEATPDGSRRTRMLYYPAYYQTQCFRLAFAAEGAAFDPAAAEIVTVEMRRQPDGSTRKEITGRQTFSAPAELRARLASAGPGTVLVGPDPARSCVPLEPLWRYTQVQQSSHAGAWAGGRGIARVQVFEFLPKG